MISGGIGFPPFTIHHSTAVPPNLTPPVTFPILNISHRILQTIHTILESTKTGIAAVTDEIPDVAGVVIVVGYNFCSYPYD